MHFKNLFLMIFCCALVFTAAPKTFAGEIDILVDKLVEKGILSRGDADEVLSETKKEIAKQAETVGTSGVPQWVQKTKLKGDFRLRYESKKREGEKSGDRGRIRYRLGIESNIVDQVKVAAGLATGSDSSTSARSTNVDLQDAFATKSINLDYAYAEYTPAEWASLIGGKFPREKYLWEPGDLLWDGDINPEGGSVQLKHTLTDWAKVSFNAGVWVVDESSGDSSDPYMYYVQPILAFTNEDLKADAKVAFTYYDFDNVRGTTLDGALGDNTTDAGNSLLTHKFMPLAVGGELGFAEPFDLEFIPRFALFGEFVHNPDPEDENNGWLLGLEFGDKKVNDKDKWQLKYMFAALQRDAFLDIFPDADRYSGGTNIKSHEGIIQYGLNKDIMVELDYYHSARLNGTSLAENLFQASANLKF